MNKLIIHIGSPRTASTAIQNVLVDQDVFLKNHSIFYGNYTYIKHVDGYSHHNLLWAIADEIYKVLKILPLYEILESPQIIADKIIENARLNSCDTILLSCELFFYTIFDSHLKIKGIRVTKEQIQQAFSYSVNIFKKLFQGFDIKIVCYIRRQDLFIESFFNQFVYESSPDFFKTISGHNNDLLNVMDFPFQNDSDTPGFNKAFMVLFNYTNYYEILKEWVSAYGLDNVIIRPFEIDQLNGDILNDFFKNGLGLKLPDTLTESVKNNSLNRDCIEYLLRLQMRDAGQMLRNISKIMNMTKSNNLYFSDSERSSLMDFHKKGNEAIARDFLQRENGILFYEELPQNNVGYSGLTEEIIFNITRELLLNQLRN